MKTKSKNPKFQGTMFDINKPSNRRRIEDRAINKPDRSMEMYNQRTLDFANIFNSGFDPLSMPVTQELIKNPFKITKSWLYWSSGRKSNTNNGSRMPEGRSFGTSLDSAPAAPLTETTEDFLR